ncbi:CaiB/BaiF CoA-transferase family protein [Hydrogenophaga sp.]|uniref:CaiB/BaiF CoA transferase family protein n=1 Tax=Hydrogenophaga sp. TaxID=1904254 RepID=UPI002720726A|nr:CoA transferase [Hydrogenophaga sp.]MDO9435149.1 CoA transferase [Hydrogenophaga sp.]
MQHCLTGIRVLDMSRIFAGPWAGQILADLGAEVIKIERPGRGDESRRLGPPFLQSEDGTDSTESAFYLSTNRSKSSIAIDYTMDEGRALLHRLIAQADVLIENYKTGTLKRYGLDYATVSAINPRLVYCSITGYGQTGPMARRPGYDTLFQAAGGLMSVTGNPDGSPGDGPMKVGVVVADNITGLYGAISVISALYHRDKVSGRGQAIDLALLDCQVATMSHAAMSYLISDKVPRRLGTGAEAIVPSQMFKSADRYIVIAVGNDEQFARFCPAIGAPELCDDPRFAGNRNRVKHREVLVPMIQARLMERSASEWVDILGQVGVPCGLVNELSDVFRDEQIQHREMVVHVDHPVRGNTPLLNSPMRFSATPVVPPQAPPTLGQHTRHILSSVLGLDAAEIEQLHLSKVVQ